MALLAAAPGRVLLPVGWSLESSLPPAGRPGPSFLALLGAQDSWEALREPTRRLLSEGQQVFIVPDGARWVLAAGSRTREEAEALVVRAARWNQGQTAPAEGRRSDPPSRTVRPFLPSDRLHEVDAGELLLRLAAVEVEGLDPSRLLQVRTLEPPLVPLLSPAVGLGLTPLVPDLDGRVRAVAHLVAARDAEGRLHVLPSLALASVMAREKTRSLRWIDGELLVGERLRVPLDASGFTYLHWNAAEIGGEARGSLKRQVNAWRLVSNLQDREQGQPPRHRNGLEGRTVILTRAGVAGARTVVTPVGAGIPAAAVHGQALVDLLGSEGLRRAAPRTDLLLTVILAFLGSFLALASSRAVKSRGGVWAYLLGGVALGAIHLAIARHLFVEQRLWIGVAGPLLAMGATFLLTTVYAFRTERQFADLVGATLGRYASPDVLGRVLRDVSLLRPERRPMTVFFSDLEGFTAASEGKPPEQVVDLLNSYLTEMSAVVRDHGGQVDKFMGDALMAFWGAPVRTPRHALLGCETALSMRTALAERQEEWERRFGLRLRFRAGLNSGEVLVGDMGTTAKSAYTVLGPVVNLASRLEHEGRRLGCDLLVGEETARLAGSEFVFREVLRLPGAQGPVRVLELMGRQSSVPARLQALLELWARAWSAYLAGDFAAARTLFLSCAGEFGDRPSELYAAQCVLLQASPPGEGWDGVAPLPAA